VTCWRLRRAGEGKTQSRRKSARFIWREKRLCEEVPRGKESNSNWPFLFLFFQQFVWKTFENSYYPTSKKEVYYPSVVMHDQNYSLKIMDIPDIPFFPSNSFYNASDLQGE